jgi:hypothetical protein
MTVQLALFAVLQLSPFFCCLRQPPTRPPFPLFGILRLFFLGEGVLLGFSFDFLLMKHHSEQEIASHRPGCYGSCI